MADKFLISHRLGRLDAVFIESHYVLHDFGWFLVFCGKREILFD